MRVNKWTLALVAEIERSQRLPFKYGEHDCLQFAGRCVKAITGVDHAESFGSYDDPAELLSRHNGVEGILTTIFGEPVHVSQAADGDIVMAGFGSMFSAGVCFGGKFFFVKESGGLIPVPRRLLIGCWKP